MSCSFIHARGEKDADACFVVVDGLSGEVAAAGVDTVCEYEGAGLGVEHVRMDPVNVSCHHRKGDKFSGPVILLVEVLIKVYR